MRAEAVTEDFAADIFLGERKALAAVSRADHAHDAEFERAHRDDGGTKTGCTLTNGRWRSGQGLLESGRGVALKCACGNGVFHLQNGCVEEAAQDVEGNAYRIAALFGEVHVVGGGQVAKEIAFAQGQLAEMLGNPGAHGVADTLQGLVDGVAVGGAAGRVGTAVKRGLEAVELFQVLLTAEMARQRSEKFVLHTREFGIGGERLADEFESGLHQGFLANDLRRDLVIAARVGKECRFRAT